MSQQPDNSDVVVSRHDAAEGNLRTYTAGFVGSLILTLVAYLLVHHHVASGHQTFNYSLLVAIIIGLALVQLVVQLVCFLHVGRESRPRWNLTVLIFAAGVVIIIVLGSLWIMSNLNYRMNQTQINNYLHSQDGF